MKQAEEKKKKNKLLVYLEYKCTLDFDSVSFASKAEYTTECLGKSITNNIELLSLLVLKMLFFRRQCQKIYLTCKKKKNKVKN